MSVVKEVVQDGCPHLANPHGQTMHVKRDRNRLLIAISLCFVFMIAEIVGGWWSGSLAIMTDAAHLLSDVAGFLISLFALTWSTKPANVRMSFGYHRAEILGALLSIAMVWALTAYLVFEAVERIKKPEPIDAKVMLIVAAIGLVVNIVIAYTLHDNHDHHHHAHDDVEQHNQPHNRQNLNIQAALIHAIGDIIQSAGVLIAALVIWWRPDWAIADPLCTFLFSVLVFGSTIMVTRDAIHILMEGTPKDVDLDILQRDLRSTPGVKSIHDLHVWSLAAGKSALTIHVLRNADADGDDVLRACQGVLCSKHNIHHATVQVESRMDPRYHCHSHLPLHEDDQDVADVEAHEQNRLPW